MTLGNWHLTSTIIHNHKRILKIEYYTDLVWQAIGGPGSNVLIELTIYGAITINMIQGLLNSNRIDQVDV